MTSQKGFVPILMALVIAIVGGYFIYINYSNRQTGSKLQSMTGSPQVASLASPNPTVLLNTNSSGNCPQQFTDKENQFTLCLPKDYFQMSNDKKEKNATNSFGPSKYKSCSQQDGSYCWVYFFNYMITDEDTSTLNSKLGQDYPLGTFKTDEGAEMKKYTFDRYRFGPFYILKLKNGKFAYFYFASSHPKATATEYNSHLEIIKSIRN